MQFTFKSPTEIVFGSGSIKQISEKVEEMASNHVFVVTDNGVKVAGILGKVVKLLEEAKIQYTIFDKINKEPTIQLLEEALDELKKSGAQVVLGLGGGSSMDTAKAAAILVKNPGTVINYLKGKESFKNPGLPVIAVPTTAGTGSELTRFAVFTGIEIKTKYSFGDYKIMAKYAILDPELTLTLPPKMTAGTGMDALTHAIESYVNYAAHPISEPIAMHAIKLVAKSLRKAVAKGDNLKAREDMLMASALAAIAFSSTRVGIVHATSQPAGAHFSIPHGISNAIMLPYVMEY
ncbi:iron-containing alcohol dehydrogenase, partial [Candidatus Bathyarchaeota archaeon]|nr:iron-containing alcohol dehydrogenase [Candidatus Bathyarchaeota archaeon]